MAHGMHENIRAHLARPIQRLATPRAVVEFYAPASAALIGTLSIDPGIGAFWQYREGQRQKGVLRSLAAAPDGYVTLAVADGAIVGFVLLCQPGPTERWGDLPGVYELSIEVSRDWRDLGIAHRLLRLTFADPVWETRVVVAQGYHWHWDLEHTGLSVWQYRELYRRLFATYGFAEFGTDDPEIYFEKANILMGRMGTTCSRLLRRRFYEGLYRTMRRPSWLEALLAAA